jgi:ubiquinone/menaquinone biosynthesis C-methylase UbiE
MTRTPTEWEKIEAEAHDRVYEGSWPFFCRDYRIDAAAVLRWQDYCYKPGTREDNRGHRTRRLFEMMDIDDLQNKNVLDVGCGNGQYAVLFALLGANVCGFDLSPIGVAIGKRVAEVNGVSDLCRLSVQSASAMAYPDAIFDVVVFHEALHHAIKYPNVHEETLRVLKPGGIVVCAETLRGNWLLDLGRKITMRSEESKGDVILELKDIEQFARGYSKCEIEPMSLLFMLKRVVQNRKRNLAVRGVLYALKRADDALFAAFPKLKAYAGECVIRLTK